MWLRMAASGAEIADPDAADALGLRSVTRIGGPVAGQAVQGKRMIGKITGRIDYRGRTCC